MHNTLMLILDLMMVIGAGSAVLALLGYIADKWEGL